MIAWLVVVFLMQSTLIRAMSTTNTRSKLVLHWFRNQDLRIHDNPALMYSCKNADVCVPVFCFDETVLGDAARTDFGTLKWGPKRAKFLTESVTDLRKQLENIGSSLIVTKGKPEKVFDDLIGSLKDDFDVSIVCQEEVLKEEKDTVKAVQSVLKRHQPKAKVTEVWGSTMYDLKDLPFDANLASMPDVFTPFRNKVEKNCKISKPLPTPRTIPSLPKDSTASKALERMMTTIPTLQDLGYTDDQIEYANSVDPRGVMNFCGGETAALARVKDYIWDKDLLKVYFETRNGMIGADYSTKFSPWLAYGCLSPRQVAMECQKYEEQRVANKSTYWVVFELLWRDFCKFFCLKHGDAVFYPSGTIGKHKKWSTFQKNFDAWKEGKTGYPLVDANMRELNATGFMSNRGRQNVCSFLAIDLNHDWRMGGDWFESYLLDYDVYSNWYNWCAGAGMTGGRLNRFNIVKQSKDYDQHGDYVRHWLPELKDVPNQFVHEPWKMNQFQQMESNCKLGIDYPNPIIPPFQPKQSDEGDARRGNKGGKQRQPNKSNRNKHQKYEMKSLKQGDFKIQ